MRNPTKNEIMEWDDDILLHLHIDPDCQDEVYAKIENEIRTYLTNFINSLNSEQKQRNKNFTE